jgi:hypothetical protein
VTENELKRIILPIARESGWLVYHVPQAPMRNGGGKGYPDLTLARYGEVLWLELKQEHEGPTQEQMLWQRHLPSARIVRPSDLDQMERLLG